MAQNVKGRYEGRAALELLDDGRIARLLEAYAYIDCFDQRWDVPALAQVDGASIPRALWTLIGGPFEGRYRNASIIHDWFCDRRTRPWQRVHRMFYEAMLTSGVSATKARILYTGVFLGGPRWSQTVIDNNQLADGISGANKAELSRAMAEKLDLTAPQTSALLDLLATTAVKETKTTGEFTIPGIGKLVKAEQKARMGRNPQTGEAIKIKSKTAVKFRVSRAALDSVNTPAKPIGKAARPASYRYEFKPDDLDTIQAIAKQTDDLAEIERLVDQQLKGRKRR